MGMAINPKGVGVEWKRERRRGRNKKRERERERERERGFILPANRFEVATGGPFPIGTRRAVEPHLIGTLSL